MQREDEFSFLTRSQRYQQSHTASATYFQPVQMHDVVETHAAVQEDVLIVILSSDVAPDVKQPRMSTAIGSGPW